MSLRDLHPRWVDSGGPGVTRDGEPVPRQRGVGVMFDCPCGSDTRRFVPFANPLDGEPQDGWRRAGESFDALTLSPSIHFRDGCCEWHGFIRDGGLSGC